MYKRVWPSLRRALNFCQICFILLAYATKWHYVNHCHLQSLQIANLYAVGYNILIYGPDKLCPSPIEHVSAMYAKCLEFHLLFYQIQSEKTWKSGFWTHVMDFFWKFVWKSGRAIFFSEIAQFKPLQPSTPKPTTSLILKLPFVIKAKSSLWYWLSFSQNLWPIKCSNLFIMKL